MTTAWTAADNVALLNVDPQDTFCPGGALGVTDGDQIIPVLNSLREHFNKVYWTQDFHPDGHISFASTHGEAEYSEKDVDYGKQMMWPENKALAMAQARSSIKTWPSKHLTKSFKKAQIKTLILILHFWKMTKRPRRVLITAIHWPKNCALTAWIRLSSRASLLIIAQGTRRLTP